MLCSVVRACCSQDLDGVLGADIVLGDGTWFTSNGVDPVPGFSRMPSMGGVRRPDVPSAVAVADADGDGDNDVLLSNADGEGWLAWLEVSKATYLLLC